MPIILFETDLILAVGFIIVSIAFLVQSWYYSKLKNIVFISYGDAVILTILLANIDKLETHADKIARLLRLPTEDWPHELKRDEIINKLTRQADKVVLELKSALPETIQKIEEIESEVKKE